METFLAASGYPNDPIRREKEQASTKSRAEILKIDGANNNANERVPSVNTFHPMNLDAGIIILTNFRILRVNTTNNILINHYRRLSGVPII